MIDQPDLFVHPESKCRGMKPHDMKAIADAMRAALTTELESGYEIVEATGPIVLYVRVAVGDLMLKAHKRSIQSYSPVGFVVHGAVGLTKDVTETIDLLKFEQELLSVRNKYARKFDKTLPIVKVARFCQIENRLDALQKLGLAKQIPLAWQERCTGSGVLPGQALDHRRAQSQVTGEWP